MKRALLPIGIFAACAAAGWLAGQLRQPATAAATDASAQDAAMPAKSRRDPLKSRMPREVSERLARIRAAENPEERLRATMLLAYAIPAGEIEMWYGSDWFDEGVQDMESYLFYRVLRMRWRAADPQALMSYCLRKGAENTSEIAGEWATQDPAAALAYLDELKDPARRSRFAVAISGALGAADPKLVLSRIPEFQRRFSENDSSFVQGIIGKLAETAPELLRAESAAWPDSLKDQVAIALTKNSLKRDFASGIAGLAGMEKGKDIFLKAVQHNSELMGEAGQRPELLPAGWLASAVNGAGAYYLVQKDPRKWLEADLAALGLSGGAASQVRSTAISQFGSKNAGELLQIFSSGTLDAASRQSAISSLVRSLPADQVESFLATLTDEKELALARQSQPKKPVEETKEASTPASLLAHLGKEGTSFDYGQSRGFETWTKEQLKGFAGDFDALSAEQKPVVALKLAQDNYRSLPREVETHVIEYLIGNPPPPKENQPGRPQGYQESKVATRAATKLAARWADEDPNAASQWVSSLPAGEERLWAAKNVASRWADYEPKAAERWMATLPEAERKEVQDYVKTGGGRNP